jgi:hypothetical protein
MNPTFKPTNALVWSAYFWLIVAIFVLSSLAFSQTPTQRAITVFSALGLIPLYGFSHQVAIATEPIWRMYFALSVAVFVGQFAWAFLVVGADILDAFKAVLGGIVFVVLFVTPMFWANFVYAFRSPHLW